MGYSQQDSDALNAARTAGFNNMLHDTPDPNWPLMRFDCIATPVCENAGELLHDAVTGAHRLREKLTVWLNVTAPTMPQYVLDAIDKLQAFGAGVVVTHNGDCSHGPNAGLVDPVLQGLIMDANEAGRRVWHPIHQQYVHVVGMPMNAKFV